MNRNVTAEIISIGTEILLGEITDTNSVHIARSMRDIGVNIFYLVSVGDNEQRITDSIQAALARADVVITTGGLGPTIDDMTRQAVAAATERGLTFHADLLDAIAARFATFRAQMTENNRRQAYLPDNSIVIENPVGTAPSFIVEHQGKVVISLPGVPREMKYLLAERVIPYLRERFNLEDNIIKARVLRTAGIGESLLDEMIGQELLEQANPTVGLAAHSGHVDVRITAKAVNEEIADRMISEVETTIRERIGDFIYGLDKETIENALIQILEKHQLKIAVVEAGIDAAIGSRIQKINGGNVLLYNQQYSSPMELQQALQRDDLLSLRDLAQYAAEAICLQNNTNVGIALVSQPNMDAQHADSEEGTAVAVYTQDEARSRAFGFGGQSEEARAWGGTWSMSMAWGMLKKKFDNNGLR
jgi:nicotinamide-nucleotide amidase